MVAKDANWLNRSCPTCGSASSNSNIEVSSVNPVEKRKFDSANKDFLGFRDNQSFFSYHRCNICQTLYCPDYFTDNQLNILYSSMPSNLLGQNEDGPARTQNQYSKFVAKYCKSINYLEIGADIGLLARNLISSLSIKNVTLIEPNLLVHSELRNNTKNTENATIETTVQRIKDKDFDLITMVHVLDHLVYPSRDLQLIHKISSNDANLMIVVHNEKSLLRKVLRSKWPPFCLQHPQLFNESTLNYLLKKNGWRIIKIKKTTNYFEVRTILEQFISILGRDTSLGFIPKRLILPFKTGNMIVLARKNV